MIVNILCIFYGDIELSLKRYKILQTAINELGRHDDEIGPYGRYLSGGFNWCSEFVSWVYREAGYALTDGSYSSRIDNPPDDGKWMHRTSERLVNWFRSNATYIHRYQEGWYNILPQVGDYVFIGRARSDRLHSGIVEFVGSDGTLHTIEGNNAGRPVMRFNYPLYRINETDNGLAHGIVLGFGVLPD